MSPQKISFIYHKLSTGFHDNHKTMSKISFFASIQFPTEKSSIALPLIVFTKVHTLINHKSTDKPEKNRFAKINLLCCFLCLLIKSNINLPFYLQEQNYSKKRIKREKSLYSTEKNEKWNNERKKFKTKSRDSILFLCRKKCMDFFVAYGNCGQFYSSG